MWEIQDFAASSSPVMYVPPFSTEDFVKSLGVPAEFARPAESTKEEVGSNPSVFIAAQEVAQKVADQRRAASATVAPPENFTDVTNLYATDERGNPTSWYTIGNAAFLLPAGPDAMPLFKTLRETDQPMESKPARLWGSTMMVPVALIEVAEDAAKRGNQLPLVVYPNGRCSVTAKVTSDDPPPPGPLMIGKPGDQSVGQEIIDGLKGALTMPCPPLPEMAGGWRVTAVQKPREELRKVELSVEEAEKEIEQVRLSDTSVKFTVLEGANFKALFTAGQDKSLREAAAREDFLELERLRTAIADIVSNDGADYGDVWRAVVKLYESFAEPGTTVREMRHPPGWRHVRVRAKPGTLVGVRHDANGFLSITVAEEGQPWPQGPKDVRPLRIDSFVTLNDDGYADLKWTNDGDDKPVEDLLKETGVISRIDRQCPSGEPHDYHYVGVVCTYACRRCGHVTVDDAMGDDDFDSHIQGEYERPREGEWRTTYDWANKLTRYVLASPSEMTVEKAIARAYTKGANRERPPANAWDAVTIHVRAGTAYSLLNDTNGHLTIALKDPVRHDWPVNLPYLLGPGNLTSSGTMSFVSVQRNAYVGMKNPDFIIPQSGRPSPEDHKAIHDKFGPAFAALADSDGGFPPYFRGDSQEKPRDRWFREWRAARAFYDLLQFYLSVTAPGEFFTHLPDGVAKGIDIDYDTLNVRRNELLTALRGPARK